MEDLLKCDGREYLVKPLDGGKILMEDSAGADSTLVHLVCPGGCDGSPKCADGHIRGQASVDKYVDLNKSGTVIPDIFNCGKNIALCVGDDRGLYYGEISGYLE